MIKELQPLAPKLKQILYGCVEHVQATKAALYLTASPDLNDKTYEIITSYQFNDPSRKVVKGIDDVVDRLAVKRDAFFVNGQLMTRVTVPESSAPGAFGLLAEGGRQASGEITFTNYAVTAP